MKGLLRNSLFLFFLVMSSRSVGQSPGEVESLGLPGDNLNLYAVLKIFQESETLEEFEKKLNDPENKINNLDLDGDNNVDYITVNDEVENNVHSISLKVATNRNEMQNVAVFVVDNSSGQPQIQVVGDEDLYGKDYIIEPNYDNNDDKPDATPNPGYKGSSAVNSAAPQQQTQTVIVQKEIITPVQIATWPIIVHIYRPAYVAWRSPWYWGYYPSYWRPWHPYFFHYYYGYHYHWNYYYQGYYRRWYHYRNPWWYNRYYHQPGWRYRSNVYYNRYNRGDFRMTYNRPDMLRDGSNYYRKTYPNSPGYNTKVPPVKVPDRRPPIAKPRPLPVNPGNGNVGIRPGNRLPPSTTNPSRPGNKLPPPTTNPTRPGNKLPPSTTKPATPPGNKLPPASRPGTRPPTTTRPVTKPPTTTRPLPTPAPKPATPRPAPKPAPRPAPKPTPRPAQ
ncbi:hypothetical protein [Pollutibacter soli]|uniref:hypothetical protein n=1 Tax=Pollutibacter soli TaxID=3034157 RepID=UPI00301413EB